MGQHHHPRRADRRALRHVRRRARPDLRRDAARQHRPRRSDRAGRLHRADDDRHARPQPAARHHDRGADHGGDRLWPSARVAQPHARRRRAAATAGDLRALRHHPERAARALHRRQPPAQGRRDRSRELSADGRRVDRRASVAAIRRRRCRHRRAATPVLPHGARPRLSGDVGRSVGGSIDGPRQPSYLCACHGAFARRHRGGRRLPRRAHQLRSGDRTRAADLRLRGRHHRRPRQHVGHARGRHHPRRVAGDRRADQSGLAALGRASCVSHHSGGAARRPVPEGAGMTASFHVEHATRASRIGTAAFAVAVVLLAAAPAWGGRDDLRLLSEIYAYVALASLWNLLAGYAGLVSVGQQAYVGLGGYVLFASTIEAGVHPLLAVPVAGAVAAVVALPVAGLLFRLRGHYFAIGTWVVAEVFRLVASQISALGGGSGTSLPAAIVTEMASSRQMREFLIYWLALALVVVVLAAIVLLLRSRYGLALTAIRDNELAARSNGVDVTRTKLVVYVLTAFGTAMVGALIFLQKLRISPDTAFSVNDWTAFVIFITVIGGIGRVEGPIIGTIVFFALRQTLADLGTIYLIMLGVVAIAVMLLAPKGIWGFFAERFGWQLLPLERRLRFAAEAGAAILHLHARNAKDGRPTGDPAVFMQFLPRIKQSTDAVINITTGGSPTMAVEERLAGVMKLSPEMCSLNMGSMNFGLYPMVARYKTWKYDWEESYLTGTKETIFRNTSADIEKISKLMGEGHGTKFEHECYDVGHLYNLAHCVDKGWFKPPIFLQLLFGILGGIGADMDNLMFMKRTADKLFGDDYSWSVLGAGRHQMPFATQAVMMGGNVRVGLEDSLYSGRGKLAQSNAEQVAKARRLIEELGFQVATPKDARAMLGLKGPDRTKF